MYHIIFIYLVRVHEESQSNNATSKETFYYIYTMIKVDQVIHC